MKTGALTLDNYARILGYPYYLRGLRNSLTVAFGGMACAVILGVPLAYLTTRYVILGRDLIATLAVLALVSPPFIGAYAWIMMLGNNGWMRSALRTFGIELPSIYGVFGILLVFSLKLYPFVFSSDRERSRYDQPLSRGSRREPGCQCRTPVLPGNPAFGVPGGELRRPSRLRPLPRRLRHPLDRRR